MGAIVVGAPEMSGDAAKVDVVILMQLLLVATVDAAVDVTVMVLLLMVADPSEPLDSTVDSFSSAAGWSSRGLLHGLTPSSEGAGCPLAAF